MSGRPTVGHLTVPYMVDATRTPIDFKELDQDHVDQCATRGRCGICGAKIKSGPIAFIGPDDGRTCFGDPWMHPACATLALEQCPFLTGRRDWREPEARSDPLLAPFFGGMVGLLATNWRSHRDPWGAWHFEAIGRVRLMAVGAAESTQLGIPTRLQTGDDTAPTGEEPAL